MGRLSHALGTRESSKISCVRKPRRHWRALHSTAPPPPPSPLCWPPTSARLLPLWSSPPPARLLTLCPSTSHTVPFCRSPGLTKWPDKCSCTGGVSHSTTHRRGQLIG